MRILHVIDSIGRKRGGPSRSSQGLVSAECRAGVDTWIYPFDGVEPWIEGVRKYKLKGAELRAADLAQFDIVLIHGIWDPRLHNVAKMCRAVKVPYIIAPRGMLAPWALKHKWLKKRVARFLYQDKDLKCAAALHATAESEAEQFRKLGFKNPVVISPNGVNVPGNFNHVERAERVDRVERRVLFVGRIHPVKGVLELVEAWGRLGVRSLELGVRNWVCELVYTVNGEFEREYEAKVKARVKELGLEDKFIFTGALNDDEKWRAYARADLFVLPTYSENFGIVVAEALLAGVPVITTKGTPWAELTECDCGWWIDVGSEPLVAALYEAMALSDEERRHRGDNGRKLVEEKYTWDAVVKAMINGYKEITDGRS